MTRPASPATPTATSARAAATRPPLTSGTASLTLWPNPPAKHCCSKGTTSATPISPPRCPPPPAEDVRKPRSAPAAHAGHRIHVHGGRMSVAGSALPGIEAERVRHWLAEHVHDLAGPVEFGLVSGGRSNLTYRLTDAAGATYALRRPPTGGVLSTAHDVSREWRFISALAPTAVPVARPVAYCADTAVTGAEFYVMEFVWPRPGRTRVSRCRRPRRGRAPWRAFPPGRTLCSVTPGGRA